jgi:carboxypeptidase Q
VAYRDAHKAELANHVFALETDSGTFAPEGFGVTANAAAIATLRELAPLLEATGATRIAEGGGGADIGPIMREGVPGAGLDVEGSRYFHYHHTPADTLDKVDPKDLKLCTAAIAIIAYLVADLPHKLGQTP